MKEFSLRWRKTLTSIEKELLRELWNKEYPISIRQQTIEAFENYLISLKDKKHLLVYLNDSIVGWYYDFIRENNRWFAIILDTKVQKKGLGSKIITEAKKMNNELNGWIVKDNSLKKSDGSQYISPLEFYKKVGFTIFEEEVFETDVLKTIKVKWKSK